MFISLLDMLNLIMINMFRIITIYTLLVFGLSVKSQELRCNVSVSSAKITTKPKEFFTPLRESVKEFVNNTKWTNHVFKESEKIECSIFIVLESEESSDTYKASIEVQSRRPIYASSINSTLLRYKDDKFTFSWLENQSMDYSEMQYENELTAVLAYYAYIVIGFDYYSFSNQGGDEYLKRAEEIVTNAQGSSNAGGWKSFKISDRGRDVIVENLLNSQYAKVRKCIYNYHRNGLDVMANNLEKGRTTILESLESLVEIYRQNPSALILRMFFFVLSEEIINIFYSSVKTEKDGVMTFLKEIDATNISKYNRINEKG